MCAFIQTSGLCGVSIPANRRWGWPCCRAASRQCHRRRLYPPLRLDPFCTCPFDDNTAGMFRPQGVGRACPWRIDGDHLTDFKHGEWVMPECFALSAAKPHRLGGFETVLITCSLGGYLKNKAFGFWVCWGLPFWFEECNFQVCPYVEEGTRNVWELFIPSVQVPPLWPNLLSKLPTLSTHRIRFEYEFGSSKNIQTVANDCCSQLEVLHMHFPPLLQFSSPWVSTSVFECKVHS